MNIAHVTREEFDRIWLALKPQDRNFDKMELNGTLVKGVFVVPEFSSAVATAEEVLASIGEPYMTRPGS